MIMVSDLFRYFTGYRVFTVGAEYRTTVADLLNREEITFRTLKPLKDGFRFKVYGGAVRRCEHVLALENIPHSEGAYRGLYPAVRFLIRRPGLALGVALFFALNYLSSRVVWNITVTGNETMSEEIVVGILEECGFTYGTYIPSVDFDALHSRIMALYPEIAWISVNVSGTVADVQMRETKFGEKTTPKGVYSNLIASEDGRIVELRVDGGYPICSPGDVVKKGQLLVSGVVPLRDGGSRFSDPSGSVFAEVERSVTVIADLTSEQKLYTGGERVDYSIKFFKKTLNLFSNGGKEYAGYDKIVNKTRITLFGSVPLPLWIEKTRRTEYVRVTSTRTYREALEDALSELRYETELLISNGELLRKTTEINAEEDRVSLTCRVLVLDNIADRREFRVD